MMGRMGASSRKAASQIVSALKEQGHSTTIVAFVSDEAQIGLLSECGADAVRYACDDMFANYDAGMYVEQLSSLMDEEHPDAVFAAHTYLGREVMARLAQHYKLPLASDVISIEQVDQGSGRFKRSVHGGKAYVNVEITGTPVLATVRPGAWRSSDIAETTDDVAQVATETSPDSAWLDLISLTSVQSERPELTEADIVVSFGRGCNEHARELAARLADLLGAALGSSRCVVDAGIASNDMQVGQTGKCVAPQLYIACGISGAIQHQAGMSRSENIVVINNDPQAPLFEIADFGIVDDVETVLEMLVQRIEAQRAGA